MSTEWVYLCIICGRDFRPAAPDVVRCPSCGGPPEAPATAQPCSTILSTPQGTVLLNQPDATEGILSTPQSAARTDEAIVFAPGGEPSVVSLRTSAEDDVPLRWSKGDRILDLYEVKGLLGEGGMGAVYHVHHTGWNLDLAVKTPKQEALDRAGGLEGFVGEAEAWIELGLHPHIVTCYYVRTLGGIPRLFAEFVEGGSLDDWIKDRRLYAGGERESLRRILDVAIQFAWGLGYAHEKGMVHQDVKPANALMMSDGTLKVTDFGLVKAKGYTALYAAPEQILGKGVDTRTDIWCWGVSVLEMFIGECTWRNGDGSIAASVLENYLANPPASLPRMPRGIADLLRDCFQEDPNRRAPNMDVVAERLIAVYQQEFGELYPREKPKELDLRADSLNNRAVSYLDLGREEKAAQFWQEALRVDPAHLEANFNYGYYRWHKAELLGSEYLKQMQQLESAHGQDPEYWRLLGWIYLEQGYVEEVEEILQQRGVQDEALERAHRDPNRPVICQIRRLEGHAGVVTSLAFSPDGRCALSGSEDKTIRTWDLTSGQEIKRMEGHTDKVISVAFYNAQYALSCSKDKSVRLWDLDAGKEVRKFIKHQEDIISAAFFPSGQLVVFGAWGTVLNQNSRIICFDLSSGQKLLQLKDGTQHSVYSVAFSPDGSRILSGGSDYMVQLWDVKSGREIFQLRGHNYMVFSVAFSPDGRYALSGGADKTVRLWNLIDGKEELTLRGHTDDVTCVAFFPDQRYAFSCGRDCAVRIWEIVSGREIRKLQLNAKSISISSQGDILMGVDDGKIQLWRMVYHVYRCGPYPALVRIRSGKDEKNLQSRASKLLARAQENIIQQDVFGAYLLLRRIQEEMPDYGRSEQVLSMLNQCGQMAGRRGLRNVWHVRSFEMQDAPLPGMSSDTTQYMFNMIAYSLKTSSISVTFSPDDRYVLSGDKQGTIWIWELPTGFEVARLQIGQVHLISSIAFSKSTRYALTAGWYSPTGLWDLATGRSKWLYGARAEYAVAFSPTGRHALSGGIDSQIRFWDLLTGKEVRKLEGHAGAVLSVSFSPSEQFALSGGEDKRLRVWDLVTYQTVNVMEHDGAVKSAIFSPDGRYILSASTDNTARLWDFSDGCRVKLIIQQTSPVTSVAFSPDGRYALLGGQDEIVQLWDLSSGQKIRSLEGHTGRVLSVAFSTTGRYALSGSDDNSVRLWEFDWEWEFPDPADWDEGARPYLDIFLTLHTPYGPDGLSRVGAPQWTEEDFQNLLKDLGIRGYGWLRPEGVRRELEKMARERGWKGR